MTKIFAALAAAALLAPGLAAAQTPTDSPAASEATPTPAPTPAPITVTTGATKLKIGGTIFAEYKYDLTEGAQNKNAFDITRAYLNIEPSWGDDFFARITPDITRATASLTSGGSASFNGNTTGNLVFRLKYAYIGWRIAPSVQLIAGLQKTVFLPWQEDNVWFYRALGTVDEDSFHGITTSDFGWSALSTCMGGRLEVHTGVFNGEKYTGPENNKYKQWDTRVTYTIMPGEKPDQGLRGTIYYSYGLKSHGVERERAIALVNYTVPKMSLAAQYLMLSESPGVGKKRVEGGGPMIFGYYTLPMSMPKMKDTRLLARVDMMDPNKDVKKDGSTKIIAGLAFRGTDKTQFVLDYQQTSFESSALKPTKGVFGHWEVKF